MIARILVAEFLGTALLVAVVVGSGIAAQRLSPGDVGLQLLENSTATVFGLGVLILVLGPVSGAHFNPVVSLVSTLTGALPRRELVPFVVVQVLGGVCGALLANAMFDVSAGFAATERASVPHLVGEVVATAGLVLVILALLRSGQQAAIAPAVAAYIGAAYWFTSSTSFANPAVTVGRMFSDTFAGIAPSSAPAFIAAQIVGGLLGLSLASFLYPTRKDLA